MQNRYQKSTFPVTIIALAIFVFLYPVSICFSVENTASPTAAVLKKLPIPGEVFKVENKIAFVIMPKQTVPGKEIPWIWYAPTLTDLPGPEEIWMFTKFLNAGIAIAGMDVGESYGSPTGCKLYTAFYDELVKNRGFSKKPVLMPRSRGGLMLYNWAADHADSVLCVAGIYPVCDISSYPGLATACSAYGLTKAQLEARLTEFNPIDRIEGLAKAKVPIFHIHGDVDTVVPLEKNSAELARRYQKFGGEMTLLVVKGQGHNMWTGFFQCKELVDFLISHVPLDIRSATESGEFK